MPEYGGQLNTFTEEELSLLTTRREPRAVSAAEAREDVETFFTLLRTAYGGYHYFGGDEVFLPRRELALAELPGDGKVTDKELEDLLYDAVQGIILDGHFSIGKQSAIEEYRQFMYYVPGLYFQDTEGLDPALIQATVGPGGEIAYCFAALSRDGQDLPRAVTGSDGQPVTLSWVRAQAFEGWSENGRIAYERRSYEGLPVLICETLEEPQSLLSFMGISGREYQSLPVFAVDLRGNWGGDDGYAQQWMYGFSGSYPQTKLAGGVKFSQLCMAARGDYESQRRQDLDVPAGALG